MSGVISKARAEVDNLSFSLFTFSSLEGRGMSEFISTLLNSFKTQALLFFLGPLGERRRIGMFRKRQSYSFGQTHAIFIALCRLITRLKGVYISILYTQVQKRLPSSVYAQESVFILQNARIKESLDEHALCESQWP